MSKKFLNKLSEGNFTSTNKVKSEFGEKMLKRMGWKEGQGLGKKNQGNAEPVQVRKRKDNLGLGATAAKQKWNHNWWEELFNDTVKSIKVVKPKKKIKVS